jgi:crotonobetainyl-CoA:carnitine CoA-transferase CaiB-like acyl-CoA transferase
MSGPLRGVRVIDLTQTLAGPYTTMLLADLGADVIKVEPPGGDITRQFGPFREDDRLRAFGGFFQSVNRGKRSIVCNLKEREGVETLLALVSGAAVLVESFGVGTMDRLGVPYERLRDINPRLVYASTRRFGDPRTGASPYHDWPAFDLQVQALGGSLGTSGGDDGIPSGGMPGIGYTFAGALTALGIVSAVLHARETGEGQYVDVAMYDGMLSALEHLVQQHSYLGEVPRTEPGRHPALSPFDVLPAADGWIAIAAPEERDWKRLCRLTGREELMRDARFATNLLRVEHREPLREALGQWTSPRTRAEIMAVLGGKVPAAPVNTIADIFADPHVRGRDMLVSVPQPGSATPVVLAGQPIKLTATPAGVSGRAPLLDEHGDEIRAELETGAAGQPVAGLEAL